MPAPEIDDRLPAPWEPETLGKGLYVERDDLLEWWTTWQVAPEEPHHAEAIQILGRDIASVGCFAIGLHGTLELFLASDSDREKALADLLIAADSRFLPPEPGFDFS